MAMNLRNINIKKSTNAAIFIPHLGCPHKCSFCDQKTTTKAVNSVSAKEVREILESHAKSLTERNLTAQIGFFGGTFTALDWHYREELLSTANQFLQKYPDIFTGIRCSTRPDYINEKVLTQLKKYRVNAVELGVQSMDDDVLKLNQRHHNSEDVRKSAKLIREFGFTFGVQMMTGLLGDTLQKSLYTANELIAIKPDTARIYPTVILKNTMLGELYERGEFETFSLEETVELCAELYKRFVQNNIKVIRLGLNISSKNDEAKKDIIGGNYGLQLGELCIGRYYFYRMLNVFKNADGKRFYVYTDNRNISKINGHKSENKLKLKQLGYEYKIIEKQGEDLIIEEI
ncbi:MAG: radical SAM protein [Oscillospiraceae bacterium]|nr:radical SAM protein [Oscillospiraceae bacterium]